MKNILVVDDSALMRRVLSDIINKDDELHADTTASNGLEALKLLESGKVFDAIILDIIMPQMDGLEFLRQLRIRSITANVLIVSTIAAEGTKETIEALELGAFDFVTKPVNLADAKGNAFHQKLLQHLYMSLGMEWTPEKRKALEEKLSPGGTSGKGKEEGKTEAWKAGHERKSVTMRSDRSRHSQAVAGKGAKKLVALACSTGGPKALQKVIPYLPPDLDASVLLVQHMPVGFTASLSARLDELSDIHVKEAEDGEVIQKGTVYIARGGSQMRLLDNGRKGFCLSVREEEARNGLKPCADIMYESLRGLPFDDITCVVMTGMGADGTKGILELEQTNKIYVIAQDAASCTVYGMPKAITETGAADEVQELENIAAAITKHVGVL